MKQVKGQSNDEENERWKINRSRWKNETSGENRGDFNYGIWKYKSQPKGVLGCGEIISFLI